MTCLTGNTSFRHASSLFSRLYSRSNATPVCSRQEPLNKISPNATQSPRILPIHYFDDGPNKGEVCRFVHVKSCYLMLRIDDLMIHAVSYPRRWD